MGEEQAPELGDHAVAAFWGKIKSTRMAGCGASSEDLRYDFSGLGMLLIPTGLALYTISRLRSRRTRPATAAR